MSRKHSGLKKYKEEFDHTSPTFMSRYQMGLSIGWKLKDLWMIAQRQKSNGSENITQPRNSEWYQKNFLGNQYEKYR